MKKRASTDTLVKAGRRNGIVAFAKDYLTAFGYMTKCRCSKTLLCKHASLALRHFQGFTKLDSNGTLTLETMRLMKRRRCPVPDFGPGELGGPGTVDSDPFVFEGNRWDRDALTWFLLRGTSDIIGEAAVIQEAFDIWSQHIPLTFSRTFAQESADFIVSWEVGDHGDGTPFLNIPFVFPNILAHAFFPQDGRIHFDDAESWVEHIGHPVFHSPWRLVGGQDLLSVAIHEIGHALGLRHSGDDMAMMYSTVELQHQLHEFDVRGIKSLYPPVFQTSVSDFVTVPLFGLHRFRGTSTRLVDLGRPRRVLAWGQITMLDPHTRFGRDHAYAVEVFDVDGVRPGPVIFGGRHWGSWTAPSNVHNGAWVGTAQRITFRISSLHSPSFTRTSDPECFGTGNIIILN